MTSPVPSQADVIEHRGDPVRATPRLHATLSSTPLDVGAALAWVADPECGGVDVFIGMVRNHHDGDKVTFLEYEAWDERAAGEMVRVGEQVLARHPDVRAAFAQHRVGRVGIGEPSVVVAASAPHRAQAFRATRDLIDAVKAEVPIWKHEFLADGTSRWPGC